MTFFDLTWDPENCSSELRHQDHICSDIDPEISTLPVSQQRAQIPQFLNILHKTTFYVS